MATENLEIPEELKILNPEWQAKPILIGTKVHTLYPLTEGQAEKLSKTISEIIYDVYTTDMKCPKCETVYRNALGTQTLCAKCKDTILTELQQEAITAIVGSGRLKRILSELFGIQEADIRKATIPQMKYIAGLIFKQNFSDESSPEGSEKNFQGLLNWMGLGTETRESLPLAPSTNTLPKSTDLPENISKESGKMES